MNHQPSAITRICILAGGVGGAKLVDGFARTRPPFELTVIGNTGDDIERHGLWVSPDMDILTYTLAGVVDREKGWGFREETYHTLAMLKELGEATWMNLGDHDLATHIFRTNLRARGVRPTEIALRIAEGLGLEIPVLPPTDDFLQTEVRTPGGTMSFQEFYLRERCRPEVLGVEYRGAESAAATPEVVEAIAGADLVVFAPSNPIASIGPILAVSGIREALSDRNPKVGGGPRLPPHAIRGGGQVRPATTIAVSPLVGGRSLKGPTDRMMRAMGFSADALGVAECYQDLVDGMVIDKEDAGLEAPLRNRGLQVLVTDTVMTDLEGRGVLAEEVLKVAGRRPPPTFSAEPLPKWEAHSVRRPVRRPHSSHLRLHRRKDTPGLFFITKTLEPRKSVLDEALRDMISETWCHYADEGKLYLAAFVVMPDHWHVLFHTGPDKSLPGQMSDADRWISQQSRHALAAAGCRWLDGYYDTLVKTHRQFCYIRNYIEDNPVRAGFVEEREDWTWSSASPLYRDRLTNPWPYRFDE